MASTRTKNLARAIQRANPGMKYTEALRHAEAGRIVINPTAPHTEEVAEMYRAAGIDMTPIDLSASHGADPLDPTAPSIRFPLKPTEQAREELRGARERLKVQQETALDLAPALWDGNTHPDLTTFLIGHDLSTGEERYLTDSHLLISGATATGKTSLAEVIMAQALITPMPWNENSFGTALIVDPKGPLARRWAGRPGVVVANGQMDAAEAGEDGSFATGAQVMASALEWVEVEYQRRIAILAREGAGSWLSLPDSVKRNEGFAPMTLVLDEALDHPVSGDDEALEKMRAIASRGVRVYRAVGMHLVLTSQRGDAMATSQAFAPEVCARAVAGLVGDQHLMRAFRDRDVPELHGSRSGRIRFTGRPDQDVVAIQVPWFGGPQNTETLDKWLPRGKVPGNGDFSLPPGRPLRKG